MATWTQYTDGEGITYWTTGSAADGTLQIASQPPSGAPYQPQAGGGYAAPITTTTSTPAPPMPSSFPYVQAPSQAGQPLPPNTVAAYVPGGTGAGGTSAGGTGTGGTASGTGTTDPAQAAADAAAAAAKAQQQQDALGTLSLELSQWGFGQDAVSWAWTEITSGKGVDQILFDLRNQPFYVNSIFGQTNKARKADNLPVMTEAQILQYKDTAMQISRSAGLPQGFMTDTELSQLMGKDVSIAELDQRVNDGYLRAQQAPPEVQQALKAYYGIDQGGLAAYYLNPDKALPLLQKQLGTAEVGGFSQRTGYTPNLLDQGVAGQVYQMINSQHSSSASLEEAAQKGFSDLAHLNPLFHALPGEKGFNPISVQTQLGAEFGGNADAQRLIKQAAEGRTAVFSGGGRFDESAKGIEGAGSAQVV